MTARIHDIMLLVMVGAFCMYLSACGGGGGVVVAGGGGGVVGTGKQVVSGEVTAFGSVFVNGIEYSTIGAAITIDDNPALESDLKAGMIVKITGTSDSITRKGIASKVEARDALEGRIDAVDTINKTILVMGQLVRVEDNVTRLNDNDAIKVFSAAGFVQNDIVEVYGYADETGSLHATRVARKLTGEFETKGFITGLGAASFSLSLTPNGASVLSVKYSAGQLPAGAVNGSRIQVKSSAAPSAGEITAGLIRLEDTLALAGEKAATEGIVTSGTLAGFVVNGQQVTTDAATIFEGGLTTDFATGVKLEAEGTMNAGGAIVATKISYRSSIKIEADASNVSGSSVTVLGRPVGIDAFTRVDPGLTNGSHVEVRAVLDRNGSLLATRIIVMGPSGRAILQGPVSASNSTAGTLTILGSALVSDGLTQWRTSSTAGDAAVTQAQFYAQLKSYSIVKVRWDTFSALTDTIKVAEIELGN